MKPGRGLGMQREQPFTQRVTAILLGASRLFDYWDSGALSEAMNGRGKIEVLVFHHEAKNRPPGTAAETVISLALRIDVKRRRLLAMERTQCPPARTRALERKIGADDLDNIAGFGDSLDGFLGDAGHRPKIPCGSIWREGD